MVVGFTIDLPHGHIAGHFRKKVRKTKKIGLQSGNIRATFETSNPNETRNKHPKEKAPPMARPRKTSAPASMLADPNSCHMLTAVDGKVEFFAGSDTAAWHGLGQVVKGQLTAAAAMEAAHLNWEVTKTPIGDFHITGDDDCIIESSEYMLHRPAGSVTEADGSKRITKRFHLGTVSDSYEVIQNKDAFDFFDSLIGEGQAVYETAGSLFGGKRVWIQADIPGSAFGKDSGDETKVKVMLTNGHDGCTALSGMIVPIRVVCNNTYSVALKGAKNRFTLKHLRNWNDEAKQQDAREVIGLAHEYAEKLNEAFRKMREAKMTQDAFMKDMLNVLYPEPEKGEKGRGVSRMNNIREEVMSLFNRGMGTEGKTIWDGFNAITEYVDHRSTFKETEGASRPENRLINILEKGGAKMKQDAFDLAQVLVG